MRDLRDIERELDKYKSELKGITRTVQKDTPFRLHELDGHSESYSYEEYLDPERAKFLQQRINDLKSQISTYARDAEAERRAIERKETGDKAWRKEKISTTAKGIYDEQVNAYMQMNLWGKAKALFSGKKPKKMNEQQIVETYGQQAVQQITAPGAEEILRQKTEQLESVRKTYANDPKMLEYAIKQTESYFNAQLEQMQKTYDSALSDVMSGGKTR